MDEHGFLQLIHEIFDPSMPRLGPGDDASTARALELALSSEIRLPRDGGAHLRVLDIGCGNGASTIQLAKLTNAHITALDDHQPYLEELMRRAEAQDVAGSIHPYLKDMRGLGADQAPFDLIWSEGALYFLGFAEGLALCHSLLAPGGSMAASELCWLKPDPPAECSAFFAEEYPPMTDVETNLEYVRRAGFEVLGHFTLPGTAWRDSYYRPLARRLEALQGKYAADPDRLAMIDRMWTEIDMYERFSSYYGYEFFVIAR